MARKEEGRKLVVAQTALPQPNIVSKSSTTLIKAVLPTPTSTPFLILASGESVNILDTNCNLQQTLPFELAFPLHSNPSEPVDALAFDLTTGRLAAHARGRTKERGRIGIWEKGQGRLNSDKNGWRVHSSFVVLHNVTMIDYANGRLVASGERITTVWELDESKVLPVWNKIGTERHSRPILCSKLSPSGQILATVQKGSNSVRLSSISSSSLSSPSPSLPKPSTQNRLKLLCSTYHSLPLSSISFRPSVSPSQTLTSNEEPILFTRTTDGIFRIWGEMIDEPGFFSLWMTLDGAGGRSLWTGWWRSERMDGENGKEGVKDEFVSVDEEGEVWKTTIENFDCRPPTCLTQSTSRLPSSTFQFSPTQLPNLRHTILLPISPHSFALVSRCSRGSILLSKPHSSTEPEGISVNSTGTVRKLVPSFSGESMLVLGDGGRIQSWDVVGMDEGEETVKETYVSELGVGVDDRVVPWHGGRMLGLFTPTSISILALQRSTPRLSLVTSLSFAPDKPLPRLSTFFTARPHSDSISVTLVAVTTDHQVLSWTYNASTKSLELGSKVSLREDGSAEWSRTMPVPLRDGAAEMKFVVLEEDGTLVFYSADIPDTEYEWEKVQKVRTGKTGVTRAVTSKDCLTALSRNLEGGKSELSIWDEKESEFASGLQFETVIEEEVVNMHWSLDAQTLAVATPQQVSLFCAQRLDDLSDRPGWTTYATVSVSHLTASPISSLCWFQSGLAISSAESVFFCSSTLSTGESCSTLAADLMAPLPYHHPQLLFQALLHGQTDVVIRVLVGLTKQLTSDGDVTPIPGAHSRDKIDLRAFLQKASVLAAQSAASPDIFSALTSSTGRQSDGVKEQLTEDGYQRLLEALKKQSMKGLSKLEHAHLSVVVKTVYEIQRQQGALDADGLRYLVSMRSFFIYNSVATVSTLSKEISLAVPRLKYRDVVWAFHSESQELLVDTSVKACPNKLTWENAKALGLFLWIKSPETLSTQMEAVGRAEYIKPDRDDKDPITAMLFYLALRKKHMIMTFWKQASGHSDQRSMIKLLANDFETPRWKSAALKNAFVLISKQRFLFAAAFFLLGSSLKDCVSVCLRQLDDWQLAVAITRVYEGDDGPILQSILEGTVLPLAFRKGYRWLASWSFWMLKRRDLAIETIITPLADLASRLPYQLDSIGSPMHEDPNLAQLFRQLRSWSLQTVKGASAVPGKTEFNFVLHMSRVLCRMGCHVLALNLVQSWQFVTPEPIRRPSIDQFNPRHSLRRLSTKIDIDIPSNIGSRAPSPERAFHKVLKETKAQTQQAPPEFDFNSFAF